MWSYSKANRKEKRKAYAKTLQHYVQKMAQEWYRNDRNGTGMTGMVQERYKNISYSDVSYRETNG